MKSLKLIALIAFFPVFLFAQKQMDVGVAIGYSNYLGDLVPPFFTFNHSSVAFGITAKQQVTDNLGIRGNVYIANIKGDDSYYTRNLNRNTSFKSNLNELSVMAEYDFYGDRRYPKGESFAKTMSPYVFAGLGLVMAKSDVLYADEDNEDERAIHNDLHVSIPIGFGVRTDLDERFYIGLEWGGRITTTDYLDGVSLTGDGSDKDVYMIGGLHLGYRIEK